MSVFAASRKIFEEEWRRRLARSLHDDQCQRVAALSFELKAWRNGLEEDDPRRRQLETFGHLLGELGEDLRRLSHDLHPAILEQRSLTAALSDHCAELEARNGLTIETDLPDPAPTTSPEVALAVYRIAQEGLANIERHAGAQAARLSLRIDRRAVRLTLTDDGAGFDVGAARRTGGLGLASMEERTRQLGGRFRIVSGPGTGTTVTVGVPQRRLSRWLRRRWERVMAAALIALALGGGLTATLIQAREAEAETRRAEAAVQFLEELFTAADPRQARGEPPGARELLQRGSERLDHELADQPLLRARLLDTLGGIQTELGLYDEARPMLEEALAIRERRRGRTHPEVASTLTRLGALAHHSGDGDAVAFFRRALEIREQRADREPAALADLLNKLGAGLAAQTDLDEAEVVFRRSLAVHEALFGADDLRVAKVLHNLSGIALYRGRPDEAETLILRVLAIREAALAEDDLDLAGTREALALLRLQQDRPAEAVALLERLVATTELVYGPEHPELARKLINLAQARAGLGDNELAREHFERAWMISQASLQDEQPIYLNALAELAAHHLHQGRLGDAAPLYRRLLALHERGVKYRGWDGVLADWDQLRAAGD